MIDIRADDRLCISGQTGTGKTVLLQWLATLAEPNILIIDPLDQYSMFSDKCRYIPKRETPQELEEICTGLFARENCTLIIEEAEQYIPQGRVMLTNTSGIIRMGRNWGIGVWASTRRIQDINKRFFDLAQHCFFFRCGLQSRDYIANMIGPEYVFRYPNPKYNKTGYTIMTLPDYHALYFNLKDETAEVVTLELTGVRKHLKTVGAKSDVPITKGSETEAKKAEKEEAESGKGEK